MELKNIKQKPLNWNIFFVEYKVVDERTVCYVTEYFITRFKIYDLILFICFMILYLINQLLNPITNFLLFLYLIQRMIFAFYVATIYHKNAINWKVFSCCCFGKRNFWLVLWLWENKQYKKNCEWWIDESIDDTETWIKNWRKNQHGFEIENSMFFLCCCFEF